jgi:hypothetical protein
MLLELPLSQGNSWNSSASVFTPDGLLDVTATGEVIGKVDLLHGEINGSEITWSDVWKVQVNFTVTAGGEPLSSEQSTLWYAPGVGVVRDSYREDRVDPEDQGWHEYDRWLVIDLP